MFHVPIYSLLSSFYPKTHNIPPSSQNTINLFPLIRSGPCMTPNESVTLNSRLLERGGIHSHLPTDALPSLNWKKEEGSGEGEWFPEHQTQSMSTHHQVKGREASGATSPAPGGSGPALLLQHSSCCTAFFSVHNLTVSPPFRNFLLSPFFESYYIKQPLKITGTLEKSNS